MAAIMSERGERELNLLRTYHEEWMLQIRVYILGKLNY